MTDPVLLDIDDGVATVTLNRPEVLNALDAAMADGLKRTFTRLESDAAVRAVLVRGAGDNFMAGGDLKDFHGRLGAPPEERRREFKRFVGVFHETVIAMRRMPQPIVSAVQGAVAGGGFSFMLATDMTVAAEDAMFTLAYRNIGASPDGGSTFALPRMVGLRRAMEIALMGDRFDAAQALEFGIVNRVVLAAELDEEAAVLARRLATGPARALAHTKRLLIGSFAESLDTQLNREAESFADCAASDDFVEGIAAFLEKRGARFTGK